MNVFFTRQFYKRGTMACVSCEESLDPDLTAFSYSFIPRFIFDYIAVVCYGFCSTVWYSNKFVFDAVCALAVHLLIFISRLHHFQHTHSPTLLIISQGPWVKLLPSVLNFVHSTHVYLTLLYFNYSKLTLNCDDFIKQTHLDDVPKKVILQ